MNKKITKDVILCFILIFILTFIMGGFMLYVYRNIGKDGSIMSSFALLQMLYPAFIIILLKIFYFKDKINNGLLKIYKAYIYLFVILLLIQIIGIFIFPNLLLDIQSVLLCIISTVTFIIILNDEDNSFSDINLNFKKNFKYILIIGLVFLCFKVVVQIVSFLESGSMSANNIVNIIVRIIFIPLVLITSWLIFFGEEFAWRGFFQPRLQQIFGKRLGVIILGSIWGVWHLPLCFMLYSPTTPALMLIFYMFFCAISSVFFAYVYMKTDNLWSVIIIHCINNTMILGEPYGNELTIKSLIIEILCNSIIFLPFLFTKEFKDSKNQINIIKDQNI